MPILALGSLRPEDQYFKISLDYTANLYLNQNEIKKNTHKNGHLTPTHLHTLHTVKQGISDSQRLDDGRDAEGDPDSIFPGLFKYIPSHIILMNNSPVGDRGLRRKRA